MKMKYLRAELVWLCFLGYCLVIISHPSYAKGRTYDSVSSHCVLWGLALGKKPSECRRRATTTVASTTACRLRHHYKAKSGETWCV